MFYNLDEQLYQTCSTLDDIFQPKPTQWHPLHGPQAADVKNLPNYCTQYTHSYTVVLCS